MRRSSIAVALLLALPAAVAHGDLPRSAELTPIGLGPLRTGMTEREVERALGRRVRQNKLAGTGGCGTAVFRRDGRIDYLLFTNDRLRRVSVGTPRHATRKGLRVGDPQSAIRKAYGDRAERSRHAYDPGGFYFSVTYGQRRLRFETDGRRVTAMHGGRIPEVDYVEGCA